MLIQLREHNAASRPPSTRQERKNATRARLLAMGEGGVRAFARARAISLDGSHDVRDLVCQCMAQYGMWGM